MWLLGTCASVQKNGHRSSPASCMLPYNMTSPQLCSRGGDHFSTPVSLDWLCDLLWPVVECSTNDIVGARSPGMTRFCSSLSCSLSWNFCCLRKKPPWGWEAPWSRNKPSGWGPLDQASTILQACEWGCHRPPSPGTWQLEAAAWVCTSLTSPDAHHLHQCKWLLLVIIGSKDFIHIAINVFPICYELNRLWKAGFGNAFHVLNHPLRDKLLE